MTQRPRPLIVYHRPGRRGEERRLRTLLMLLQAQGLEAGLASIEEALEAPPTRAYLLLFTRGGHWRSLVDAGHEAYTVPPWLTASCIASEARRRGAAGAQLVALRAHRLRGLQAADLAAIEAATRAQGLGARAAVLPSMASRPPQPPPGWVNAPLALLDGRLAGAACSTGPCLGPLLDYCLRGLAAWIASEEERRTAAEEEQEHDK